MKWVVLLVAVLLCVGCSTLTPRVSLVDPNTKATSGFLYALPRTTFVVSYKVSRTEFVASTCKPQDGYSEVDYVKHLKMLGLNRTEIKGQRSLYSLSEGALTASSGPDPEHVYVVEPTDEYFADSLLKLSIGPDGVAHSTEASGADKVGPAVIKVIEVAGALAGTVIGMGATQVEIQKSDCTELVEDYEVYAKAREALRTSPAPHPKDVYELRMTQIVAEQARIKSVFLGLKSVTTSTVLCEVVPDIKNSVDLLALHPESGLVINSKGGCLVNKQFLAGDNPVSKKINVSLLVRALDTTLADRSSPIPPDEAEAGLYYRVPGVGFVVVETSEYVPVMQVPGARHFVTQLGVVRSHPRVKGSNPRLVAELHPETGALKTIIIEEKGTDASAYVTALGSGGSALLAGEKERRARRETEAKDAAAKAEKEAASQTPLAQLQAEQAILEVLLAVQKAKEALQTLQAVTPASE